MNCLAALGAACGILLAGHASSASAAPRPPAAGASALEISAQARVERRRPPRITVRPRDRSGEHPIYPRPGDYSYPGPNAVRECTAWLQPENRPSGTVITPQMRCWWVNARAPR
jgi:hypothetical protein